MSDLSEILGANSARTLDAAGRFGQTLEWEPVCDDRCVAAADHGWLTISPFRQRLIDFCSEGERAPPHNQVVGGRGGLR
jgi:hypothetical protein